MTDNTCAQPECGASIPPLTARGRPRKWCATHAGRKDSTTTKCSNGCDKFVRARGLCGTCYNRRFQPNRHQVKEYACAACGKPVLKHSGSDRRPVCSTRCRAYLQFGKWPHDGKELVGPVVRLPRYPLTSPVVELPKVARAFTQGECVQCGDTFTRVVVGTTAPARYCSTRCGKRAGRARNHERNGHFWVSDKRRQAIYDRDGWICQLCFDPVDPALPVSDDWAPSLDHIIPQSRTLIPDHSDGNLRLSHRWCNAVRGDETYYTAADLAA